MDRFSLCLDGLCLLGQGMIHLVFIGRLTGKRPKPRHFAVYLSLLCAMQWFFTQSNVPAVLSLCAELLILYGMSRLALGNRRSVSWVAALLAVYISQLSFGIVNPAEAILFPRLVGNALLYPLLLLATLTGFAVCLCCCAAVLKFLSLTDDPQLPYVGLLLFPGLFFFAVELYILQTAYSVSPPSVSLREAGRHGALFLMQLLGLAALLCTLYAYRHICRGFRAQAALRSLEQAAQAQKTYIAEARARCEQTRAFRHDIANHLSVLDGLLNRGAPEEAKAYLRRLKAVSDSLSSPYQTGDPVVDILLSEKLGLTEDIAAEVSLVLPRPCGIDEFDLCVIFANALDNAIRACRSIEGERSIRISGERQGDFYLLAFENTCQEGPLPPAGTGLSNIRAVAEKYHGAILTEKAGRHFSLNVLLNIS